MSMAETFKGRNTAKTGDELKKARESRAAEALRMKDDQLRILAEQNSKLLASLDKVSRQGGGAVLTHSLTHSHTRLHSLNRAIVLLIAHLFLLFTCLLTHSLTHILTHSHA